MVHFETFFLYERRTEMSVLVMIMLLHANNIIFVGFWPNHFALSVYTTTDRIFQDVAFFLRSTSLPIPSNPLSPRSAKSILFCRSDS